MDSPTASHGDQERSSMLSSASLDDVRKAQRKCTPGRNSSIWGAVEANSKFQNMTLGIIVVNALWIFIDTEWNHSRLADDEGNLPFMPFSTAIENFFCAYFTAEVVIRFLAFRDKKYFMCEGWFVFDSILVLMMVLETWIAPILIALSGKSGGRNLSLFAALRLLRLARLTRMVKLMAVFTELRTLVKGMARACSSVNWIMMFLVIIMYIFAIIFVSQLGSPGGDQPLPGMEDEDPTAEMLFSSMFSAMMTLFTNGVLGDNLAQTVDTILQSNLILMWVFVFFTIISSLTLLNMLIGVLFTVIDDTTTEEAAKAQMYTLRECLTKAFEAIDEDNDGLIGRMEWARISQNESVIESLMSLGIERDSLEERLQQLEETIFPEETARGRCTLQANPAGLTLDEFMDKITDLGPKKAAAALDLEDFKAQIVAHNRTINKSLDDIDSQVTKAFDRDRARVFPDRHQDHSQTWTYPQTPSFVPYEDNAGEERKKSSFLHSVPSEVLLQVLKMRC